MTITHRRNPVLLLHGITDTRAVFDPLAAVLNRQGYMTHSLDLVPCNGSAPLDCLAEQVANYVTTHFAPDQPFDLVGFSMGGIVGRYFLQRLGGLQRVQRFITLASPHFGTWVAYGSQRPACLQMRPDSPFLQELNRDLHQLAHLNVTSIWTPYDLMIVPANSSVLPIGQNWTTPVLLHSWMLSHAGSIAMVAEALAQPLRSHVEPPLQPPTRPIAVEALSTRAPLGNPRASRYNFR